MPQSFKLSALRKGFCCLGRIVVLLRHLMLDLKQLSSFLVKPLPEGIEYIHFAAPGWRKSLLCQHHWRGVFLTNQLFVWGAAPVQGSRKKTSQIVRNDVSVCKMQICLAAESFYPQSSSFLPPPLLQDPKGIVEWFSNTQQQKLFNFFLKLFFP